MKGGAERRFGTRGGEERGDSVKLGGWEGSWNGRQTGKRRG